LRPFTIARKSPSAIGLRQMFPVQMKRTSFAAAIRLEKVKRRIQARTAKSTCAREGIVNREW
jgi:hypothetical protein